jgi:hypothetical protein
MTYQPETTISQRIKRKLCYWHGHDWLVDDGCRRTCRRCGAYQMLMMRPFPSTTEPSLQWRDMA